MIAPEWPQMEAGDIAVLVVDTALYENLPAPGSILRWEEVRATWWRRLWAKVSGERLPRVWYWVEPSE